MGPEGLGEAVVNMLIFGAAFLAIVVTVVVLAWQGRHKRQQTQHTTRVTAEARDDAESPELVASASGNRRTNARRQ